MDTDKLKEIPEATASGGVEAVASAPEKPVSTWRPQDADREIIKANIRRRVWSSNASPKAQFIPAKPLPTVQDEGQKRVAVYARVSTKSTEQVSSIENQTRYYTEKIEKTPNCIGPSPAATGALSQRPLGPIKTAIPDHASGHPAKQVRSR